MKKFYAIVNPLQKGARDEDGLPFTDGYIHIFSSRKSRDEWVNEDAPDELGFYHRQGLYADVGTYQLIERDYITCVYHDEDEDDGYADAIEALLEGRTPDLPKQAPITEKQKELPSNDECIQDFVICNEEAETIVSGSCAEEVHATPHKNRANKSGVREISDIPRKERRKNKKKAKKEKKRNSLFKRKDTSKIERLSDEWLELSENEKSKENWKRAKEIAKQSKKGYDPNCVPESRLRAYQRMNFEDRWQEAQVHNQKVDESKYPLNGARYNRTGVLPWWGYGLWVSLILTTQYEQGFKLSTAQYYGFMALGIFEYILLLIVIVFTAGIGGAIFLAILNAVHK